MFLLLQLRRSINAFEHLPVQAKDTSHLGRLGQFALWLKGKSLNEVLSRKRLKHQLRLVRKESLEP